MTVLDQALAKLGGVIRTPDEFGAWRSLLAELVSRGEQIERLINTIDDLAAERESLSAEVVRLQRERDEAVKVLADDHHDPYVALHLARERIRMHEQRTRAEAAEAEIAELRRALEFGLLEMTRIARAVLAGSAVGRPEGNNHD